MLISVTPLCVQKHCYTRSLSSLILMVAPFSVIRVLLEKIRVPLTDADGIRKVFSMMNKLHRKALLNEAPIMFPGLLV